ncbi:MAG: hypothetical protein AB7G11_06315 [Phycisphaerales bacterium]
MVQHRERNQLGPFLLIRSLAPAAGAARWLALHESHHTSHIVYQFPACHDKNEQRRFLSAVQTVCVLSNSHIQKIEQYSFDGTKTGYIVTPFPGDASGLLFLDGLLRAKGGRMHADEAQRATVQLLEAFEAAHAVRLHHGPLSMSEVIVDRHGSLIVELFGLHRQLRGLTQGNSELVRDEVRSIVEIAYQLLTGLRAEEPIIPAGRLVKRLDPEWDLWLERGLDPADGFATAREAIDALPGSAPIVEVVPTVSPVLSFLGRLGLVRR